MNQKQTKQQVTGEHTGLLRRLGAMLYDSILILGLIVFVMILISIGRGMLLGWDNFDANGLRQHPLYIATLLAVPALFYFWFWSHGGQTLGMKAWRLTLTDVLGKPPAAKALLLRLLASIISWVPCGLGFLWSLIDREKLTWHDRLSATRLIHLKQK
ncbi:MAG: RDD family protein [Gammaproteobacteria bacterium]|nr:RDD family protein [Gammaproteobacteria bacterium]